MATTHHTLHTDATRRHRRLRRRRHAPCDDSLTTHTLRVDARLFASVVADRLAAGAGARHGKAPHRDGGGSSLGGGQRAAAAAAAAAAAGGGGGGGVAAGGQLGTSGGGSKWEDLQVAQSV
jgi:hypothetical protein